MPYFAEIDGTSTVLRVIVAPDLAWCEQNLGGVWRETRDPYVELVPEVDPQVYAGPGW